MTDKLKEAIEVLKKNRERDTMLKRKYQPNAGEKYYNERSDTEEAIDTVISELEKPLPKYEDIITAFDVLHPIDINNSTLEQCFLQGIRQSAFLSGARWMRNLIKKEAAE